MDLRSLALFRIVLGTVILIDLLGRLRFLELHYTDQGLVPRELLLNSGRLNDWHWSLNLVGGTTLSQAVVFLAAGIACFALIGGIRTRPATVVLWVLMVSIQTRNPLVLNSADSLVRLLLFWSMFVPLGAVWSIDAKRDRHRRAGAVFASWGTAGLLVQVVCLYLFTALLKTDASWRVDGSALYYALGAQQMTTPIGNALHDFEGLLRAMTFATIGIEALAPILLFFPFFVGPVRTAATLLVSALHLGILATLWIGIFPLLGAGCMVVFLPRWFWDTALPTLLNTAARFIHTRGGIGLPRDVSVGVPSVTVRTSFNWRSLSSAVLHPWHDATSAESVSADGWGPNTHPVLNLLAALCLAFVLAANVETVTAFRVPEPLRPVGHTFGLFQRWSMYAPGPLRSTDWYVVRGTLANGGEVDLLRPLVHGSFEDVRFVSWEQPAFISETLYRGEHWRKYLNAITFGEREERRVFAAYLCRTWNGMYDGDEHLESVDVVQMRRRTLPDYAPSEVVPVPRFEFQCS